MTAGIGELPTAADLLRACERGARQESEPATWLDHLARAITAEASFALEEARTALDLARPHASAGPLRQVVELVEARLLVRAASEASLHEALARLAVLRAALDPADRALAARVLHLIAIAHLRRAELEPAELAIGEALAAIEPGPAQLWIIDTLAQLLVGQGAWVEATLVLENLVARRAAAGDGLGIAISAGHLARLHAQLGRHDDAARVAREALAALPAGASPFSAIRLWTLLVEVELARDADPASLGGVEEALRAAVAPVAGATHYLVGFAHLALSRARVRADDRDGAEAERAAAVRCALPAAAMLQLEATIDPEVTASIGWQARFAAVAERAEVTEAEITTHLLLAAIADGAGDARTARGHLERAGRRATSSNHPIWARQVDEAIERRDPVWAAERFTERFAGRSRGELARTSRERVTMIFADLVDFTPRTLELAPEQVMSTVRGLFELGVPLLAKFRVLPISYLGDGLLAIAQGDDHAARALAFARALVARAGRASEVRDVLGLGWPLHLRAGVATGEVVIGVLGSMFKSDLAAIGLTTNLASRLQGTARPGEVVCCADTAREAGLDLPREPMQLKGFGARAIEACRIRVHAPPAG